MTEEEKEAIKKMYEEGLVNVSKIAEPLINKYKELDYQQCQFVIEYLLADIEIKDKVIDLMAEDRVEIGEPKVSKQAIIDFYYKKVGGEDE